MGPVSAAVENSSKFDMLDANTSLALTNGAAFLSQNNGQTWAQLTSDVPSVPVYAYGNGFLWLASSVSATNTSGDRIAKINLSGAANRFDVSGPPSPTTRINALDGRLFVNSTHGLFSTDDGGETWQLLRPQHVSPNSWLALCETTLLSVSADTTDQSIDRGNSWSSLRTNHWIDEVHGKLDGIAVVGSTVFVAIKKRSFSEGTTVTGIYSSNDLGKTWNMLSSVSGLNILFDDGTRLLAGTEDGIYEGRSNGTVWSPYGIGIGHQNVTALMKTGKKLIVGTQSAGLFVLDAGAPTATWKRLRADGLDGKVTAIW
jgi:hypothetical protein